MHQFLCIVTNVPAHHIPSDAATVEVVKLGAIDRMEKPRIADLLGEFLLRKMSVYVEEMFIEGFVQVFAARCERLEEREFVLVYWLTCFGRQA